MRGGTTASPSPVGARGALLLRMQLSTGRRAPPTPEHRCRRSGGHGLDDRFDPQTARISAIASATLECSAVPDSGQLLRHGPERQLSARLATPLSAIWRSGCQGVGVDGHCLVGCVVGGVRLAGRSGGLGFATVVMLIFGGWP